MKKETYYSETANIICIDNDKVVVGEILTFVPGKFLSVAIAKAFKLNLQYNDQHKVYQTDHAGLTFQSTGPTELSKQW